MNFDLTEERQMLQDTLRRFLRDKYDTATRNKIIDSDSGMSDEIWTELAELGVIGALFTEEQGGFGGKGFDIAVVFEELGRAGVVEPFLGHWRPGRWPCGRSGHGRHRKSWSRKSSAVRCQMAFAHGEPTSRYDLNRVQTSAKTDGDDIVLNGHKAVVVNAEAADHLVISARESGAPGDDAVFRCFLSLRIPRA